MKFEQSDNPWHVQTVRVDKLHEPCRSEEAQLSPDLNVSTTRVVTLGISGTIVILLWSHTQRF